jgi:ATP-dependent DNA helicase RecQ
LAETEDCRRVPLLQYFGEPEVSETCAKCDNCLSDDKQKSDLTVPAQKFLSCVHRTGQRFGAAHIVDVLRGSNAEKVLQNQHNLLSTYNIGNELNKKQWMTLSRQLIQKKLLRQDEQFGGLKLTQLATDVLKGKAPFFAMLQQATPEKTRKASQSDVIGNTELVSILKTERKLIADKANVPPYAIFADRSLQEMAYYLPHSEQSLLKIHGVGSAKLAKYGDIFLSLVIDFCKQHDLQEIENSQSASVQSKKEVTKSVSIGSKTKEVVERFESGESIAELSSSLKVKDNTIFNHLYKYAQAGNSLNKPERIAQEVELDEAQIEECLVAFDAHGTERLKPVYEALGEKCSYEQLHLMRVLYICRRNA